MASNQETPRPPENQAIQKRDRGDRGALAALALLVAATLIVSFVNMPAQQGIEGSPNNRRNDNKPDNQQENLPKGHLPVPDTPAQWLAAVAAAAGTISSFLALLIVRDSLHETRNAVAAAKEANSIGRETGQAQTRAYLSVTSADVLIRQGVQFLNCVIKNNGQSPASEVALKIVPTAHFLNILKAPTLPSFEVIDFGLSECEIGSLAPGEQRADMTVPFLPFSALDRYALDPAAETKVSIQFFLSWTDVFGVRCENSGIILARSFVPHCDPLGGIAKGTGDVRTTVYDTTAWLKLHAEKQPKA